MRSYALPPRILPEMGEETNKNAWPLVLINAFQYFWEGNLGYETGIYIFVPVSKENRACKRANSPAGLLCAYMYAGILIPGT